MSVAITSRIWITGITIARAIQSGGGIGGGLCGGIGGGLHRLRVLCVGLHLLHLLLHLLLCGGHSLLSTRLLALTLALARLSLLAL